MGKYSGTRKGKTPFLNGIFFWFWRKPLFYYNISPHLLCTPSDPPPPQSHDNPFTHPVKLQESGSEMGGALGGSGSVLWYFIPSDQQIRGKFPRVLTSITPVCSHRKYTARPPLNECNVSSGALDSRNVSTEQKNFSRVRSIGSCTHRRDQKSFGYSHYSRIVIRVFAYHLTPSDPR